jgi:hypothetical protein
MFDNLILPETQTQYKLTKTWQYVAALLEIGCRRFTRGERGEIYIDGKPYDRIKLGEIRTKLRDRNLRFSTYWLNDVIKILAAEDADITELDEIPFQGVLK